MAGCETLKGAASSATVASPSVSRARIARRVGSARAPKTALSWSTLIASSITVMFNNTYVTYSDREVRINPQPPDRASDAADRASPYSAID